ncbi:unnamed protein product [Leuciscus chuanchicus]
MWLFLTAKRQTLFQERLRAAKRNSDEKKRRVWELLQSSDYETNPVVQSRRKRICFALQSRRGRPSVWAFNRATEWWDVIVPGFTNAQWVQNFRMSEETFIYLYNKLRPVMERQDTSFRKCVPLKKRVAIALWKLATGSEYRTVGHLFGVSITTVCRCVQEFTAAAETLLVPEQIRFPDQEKFEEMAAYIENRWGLPQCVGAIVGSHIPKKICRARVVVENAFGRLKGRWRCLMKRNDCDVTIVKSMILSCCALHNLCETHGEDYDNDWDAPAAAEPVVAVAQGVEEEGRDVREGLMRYFNC